MKKLLAVFTIAILFIALTPIFVDSQGLWKERRAYDENNRIQYVGRAKSGTAETTAGWAIYRLAYDGTSRRITSKDWAGGDASMKWRWDLRETYAYS